jgi:hypothetical protein
MSLRHGGRKSLATLGPGISVLLVRFSGNGVPCTIMLTSAHVQRRAGCNIQQRLAARAAQRDHHAPG